MSSDSGQDGDRSSAVRAWVDSTAGDSTTTATAGPITSLPIRTRVRAAQAGDIDPERDADESSIESPTTASRAGSVETRPTDADTSDGVANGDQNDDGGDTLSQVSSDRSRQSAGQVEAGNQQGDSQASPWFDSADEDDEQDPSDEDEDEDWGGLDPAEISDIARGWVEWEKSRGTWPESSNKRGKDGSDLEAGPANKSRRMDSPGRSP